jgi:hypothetical protein
MDRLNLRVVAMYRTSENDAYYACEHETGIVLLTLTAGTIYLDIACATEEAVDQLLTRIRSAIPQAPKDDHKIDINFWHYVPEQGPQKNTRRIEVPHWDEIRVNYADETSTVLDALLKRNPDELNGHLILWHGEPGTGKTYALRSLGHRWRDVAGFNYIVDPEQFFATPGYMMQVMLENSSSDQYKFLVLEDSGEMLTADAKERVGQGLSRLLNIVDGILGQGLKIMVLVTTNEELRALHPAVAREGRCAALCEFLPLEADKADQWLIEHDCEPQGRRRNLSELYANTRPKGILPQVEKRIVGFHVVSDPTVEQLAAKAH